MIERTGLVSGKGKPLTLIGNEVKVGETAPDVELIGNDLSPVKLSSYRGKVCVIATVPSLDTGVCDTETRKFNQQAADLGENVRIITVSIDLPFALRRWCGAAGIDKVITLSDYKHKAFGEAYGVLLKETRWLARTIFVIDAAGIVRYIEYVKDIGTEPDYEAALSAVKNLA